MRNVTENFDLAADQGKKNLCGAGSVYCMVFGFCSLEIFVVVGFSSVFGAKVAGDVSVQ